MKGMDLALISLLLGLLEWLETLPPFEWNSMQLRAGTPKLI